MDSVRKIVQIYFYEDNISVGFFEYGKMMMV
jgi:hypothetical protein